MNRKDKNLNKYTPTEDNFHPNHMRYVKIVNQLFKVMQKHGSWEFIRRWKIKNSGKKKINRWEWAFSCLVALIVISYEVVLNEAITSTPVTTTSRVTKPSDSPVTTGLNKKQVNALTADYLNQFLKGQKTRYDSIVGD